MDTQYSKTLKKKSIQEDKIISYQVVRIEPFNKNSLVKIGAETERTATHNRNEDIAKERTPLNFYYKKSDGGLNAQWKKTMKDLEVAFNETAKSIAFEGMIITSDPTFFEKLGYVPGMTQPIEVMYFFDRAYKFALSYIGYHGTDKNILSAVIHFDETTPHLQLYYLPIVDTAKKKVYAKGSDGKVLRNEKGSPVQAKDERGKSVYEYVKLDKPKLCSSDFWAERGGQLSYGNMQDEFYSTVSIRYGLERGEVGSNKKHTTKYQWQKQQQETELAAISEEAQSKEKQAKLATSVRDEAMNELTEIEKRKEKVTEDLKPLEEYLDAFNEALSGTLPLSPTKLRKMIIGLTTEYKRLESEKKITDKDRENLFSELQAAQKRIPTLEKYRDLVILLNDYAPDKLDEAKRTANERKNSPKPPFKRNSNYNGK